MQRNATLTRQSGLIYSFRFWVLTLFLLLFYSTVLLAYNSNGLDKDIPVAQQQWNEYHGEKSLQPPFNDKLELTNGGCEYAHVKTRSGVDH